MNKLIALATFVVVLNLVKCDVPICGILGNDPDKYSNMTECISNNFPEVVLNLFAECYQTSFGSPGRVGDFLKQVCADEKDHEGLAAMEKCVYEEGEKVQEVSDDEVEQAIENAELCYLRKAGLSEAQLAELVSDDDDEDSRKKK